MIITYPAMIKKLKIIFYLTFIFFVNNNSLSSKEANRLAYNNFEAAKVVLNNKKFRVEIADSEEERNKGLMFRKSLCLECGMFFIFAYPSRVSFWMKNTLIPLDIVFIEKVEIKKPKSKAKKIVGKVVDLATLEPCPKNQPCIPYQSRKPAHYVLEVNAGTFTNVIGKKVTIENIK